MVPEVPCEGAQGGLLLGEIAFQFAAQSLQFLQVGFHVFGQHVLEPLTHALGQNRCLAVCADGQLQRAVGHDAPHVEVTPVGDVGHIQKVAHQSPETLGPTHLARFDGGDDADNEDEKQEATTTYTRTNNTKKESKNASDSFDKIDDAFADLGGDLPF